jgi:hypothetical protein
MSKCDGPIKCRSSSKIAPKKRTPIQPREEIEARQRHFRTPTFVHAPKGTWQPLESALPLEMDAIYLEFGSYPRRCPVADGGAADDSGHASLIRCS